jgi:hypothetical protein
MCASCALQGLEQGAAAGSASGAVGLLGAGLASIGFRGAADRLVGTRVEWLDGRWIKLASAVVALVVLLAIVALQPL